MVAPRSTPGRKCTAPCAVSSEYSLRLAVAMVCSRPAWRGLGAQDGPPAPPWVVLSRQNAKPDIAMASTRQPARLSQNRLDRREPGGVLPSRPRPSRSAPNSHQDI